jgi:hypothetical protein
MKNNIDIYIINLIKISCLFGSDYYVLRKNQLFVLLRLLRTTGVVRSNRSQKNSWFQSDCIYYVPYKCTYRLLNAIDVYCDFNIVSSKLNTATLMCLSQAMT